MQEGKHERRKVQIFEKYSVLILIATILMSIGYAEITGVDLSVTTNVESTAQDGVFITDITRTEYDGADITLSQINSYIDTTMNSTVVLGGSGSYITYNVSVYNKTDREQVFIGPFSITGEGLYDNELITYELSRFVPYETVLQPGKNYDFDITFKYAGSDMSDNTLTSRINFRFMEKPELAITGDGEITGLYPGCEAKSYSFKVVNYDGDTVNNVALSYGLTAEIQKPFTAKIYDANGTEVTSLTAVDVDGKDAGTGVSTKVEHEYTLKVMWDSTNAENGIAYNSVGYAGQTYTAQINVTASPKANAEGINKYESYQLTQEKEVTVKTEPLYIKAEPNNTTIEMTNNRAEINLAVSNNDGTNTNAYDTKYTISQDNSKYTLYVDETAYTNNITGQRTISGNLANIVEKIWLVPKTGVTLNKEETANITINITSPYVNKTETVQVKVIDTTGPTAPTITGGSESYLASQTISVSEVATDVGTGVKNYEYLVNNTEQAIANATGNVGSTEAETSKTFDTEYNGYYVWFRAVDAVGNKGEWSNSQKLNVDPNPPTVGLAIQGSETIEEGATNDISTYFTYDKNGNAGITSTVYTDTSNGNKVVSNTSSLAEGTHVIRCTVTKENGLSAYAEKTIVVESNGTKPVINSIVVTEEDGGLTVEVDAVSANEVHTTTFPIPEGGNEYVSEIAYNEGFEETEEGLIATNTDSYCEIPIDLTSIPETKKVTIKVYGEMKSSGTGNVEGYIYTDYGYGNFESDGESENETINCSITLRGGIEGLLFAGFYNLEEDPTVASFKITRIDIIIEKSLEYEYNINNEGYTEQTTDNTYFYSESLQNTNTITVRVTNYLGKQATKTLIYIKGIIITPGTNENDVIAHAGEQVTVDVIWPSGSEQGTKQIKIGNNEWKTYTGQEVITENCKVMARVINGTQEVQSSISSLEILLMITSVANATTIQSATTEYQDAKGNSIVVPGGFKVRTDLATTVDKGIVIEDSSGNQFVWIPIGTITTATGGTVNIEFGRYSYFSTTASPRQYASNYASEDSINSYYLELSTYRTSNYAEQVANGNATAKSLSTFISNAQTNKGYYLARYEASFGSGDKISSVSDGTKGVTNQKPAFKQSTSANSSSNIGTVTSTPGMLWNYIRQGDASLACQNLYAGNEYNSQDFVECDLVNSYAWDTAIMFIQKCSDKTDYANQTDGNSTLYNTGTATGKTTDIACNIYDMAGNLSEWTTEYSSHSLAGSYYSCVYRGGDYYFSSSCTADRHDSFATLGFRSIGFRSVLYVL